MAGVYTYNADGQRVRRKVNAVETWQVYGFDGELLAEYGANVSAASSQKEYGYRNGQLLVTAEPSARTNVAAAANGGVASASSELTISGYNWAPSGANNSDRMGVNWSHGGGWADASEGSFPDWLQIDFNGSKTIDEIDAFTLQNNYPLGKPGVANGIVVTIGKTVDPRAAGETNPNNIGKGTITITFNEDKFSGESVQSRAVTLGHEGVHADDAANILASSKSMAAFFRAWESYRYQTEYDAHFVDAGIYQVLARQNGRYNYVRDAVYYTAPTRPGKAEEIPHVMDLWNPS